ncbi:MAG: type II toxin-antitoxin system RelE/ParE family toxin [Desulfuromonadales bacterium]|nr:type II toxin-antitoxin system RelE/ParE family toxin [Chloroflexota bacterium]MCK4622397.1 type II toxin-antitoxin system RelE/ParE family toxin [Desulfuromonadales bacterium]
MANFTLTVKAKSDLKYIARYTQKRWGKEQRNKYLKILDDSLRQLAGNPSMGRECSEIRNGYHKFPTGSHVIFYRREAGRPIEIVRVLHENMDVEPRISKN